MFGNLLQVMPRYVATSRLHFSLIDSPSVPTILIAVCPPVMESNLIKESKTPYPKNKSHGPSCQNDSIDFNHSFLGPHPVFRDFENGGRCLRNVNKIDVGTIENLVIVLFKTWTFGTEGVRWCQRSEKISFSRISDSSARFFGPKVVRFVIGLRIE